MNINPAIFISTVLMSGLFLFAENPAATSRDGYAVHVIITVESRSDRPVPLLGREDIAAYEGHERVSVSDFKAANERLELFLLLDDASSSSFGVHLEGLRRFVRGQAASTSVGIGYMRNGMVDIAQNVTADHDRAAQSIRLPLSSSGAMASPYLSLSDLIKRWQSRAERHEVVMVTSGVDPLGGTGPMNPYLTAAIQDAQRAGIPVYAIYVPAEGHAGHSFFRMNWGQNHLAQLTEETGGEAYMLGFGPPVAVEAYLDEISAHLSHQYYVTVLMKERPRAEFRKVTFTTEVPGAELIAPARVYVPAASRTSK